MKTQSKVFLNLQKFKKRKELGAVEDAIREAIERVKAKGDELFYTSTSLNAEIDYVVGQIESLKEGLESTMNEYKNDWNRQQSEFEEIASELDNNGVGYNNPFGELSSNWEDVLYYGDIVLKSQIK
jgi:hypothetical protein